jgi:flagellar biosynthesis anti-sigma factor FlgM
MKITSGPQSNIPILDAAQKKPVAKPGQKDKSTGNAFSVQLSKAVEQVNKPAAEDDEVRRQKVEAIRQQLASGTYNISGKDVAGKILNALKG